MLPIKSQYRSRDWWQYGTDESCLATKPCTKTKEQNITGVRHLDYYYKDATFQKIS